MSLNRPRFFLIFVFFIFLPNFIYSHPLDITYTTLVPKQNYLLGKTYIHPFELNQLASANRIEIYEEQYPELPPILFQYFRDNFKVFSDEKQIALNELQLEEKSVSGILADGIYIFFKIPKHKIYKLKVTLFLEYSCTQSNKMILLNKDARPVPGRPEIIFTRNRQTWTLNLEQPDFSADLDNHADADKDGLSNHLEFLFGTDSTKVDTDGDRYTDFEEIYMGWNPLNRRYVKGQRSMYLKQMSQLNSSYKSLPGFSDSALYYKTDEPVVMVATPRQSIALPNVLNSETGFFYPPLEQFIEKIQHRIGDKILRNEILLALVFLYGLIHVFSLDIRKHKLFMSSSEFTIPPVSQILKFVAIHMSDVFGLSIILLYMLQKFPFATWFNWIQVSCWIGLLILAIIYLIDGIRKVARNRATQNHNRTNPDNQWNGIFRKLNYMQPYSHRWLAFMFIVSLGKIEILLSSLGLFSIGVLIAFLLFRRSLQLNPGQEYNGLGYVAQLLNHLMLLVMLFSVVIPAVF